MGYAGGTTPDPTYQSIGDHSEALQIDFDPAVISYELLAEFFASHNPCRAPFMRQYRSAIFPTGADQARAAAAAGEQEAAERGESLATDIEPFMSFTLAEDYHQKYRLRAQREVLAEYAALFPTTEAFLGSAAVTRANAFLGGYGSEALVQRDLPRLGLSDGASAIVERQAR